MRTRKARRVPLDITGRSHFANEFKPMQEIRLNQSTETQHHHYSIVVGIGDVDDLRVAIQRKAGG